MLTKTDVDADWQYFDNVKQVYLLVQSSSENYLGLIPPHYIDALLFERDNQFTDAPNGGEVHRETRLICLRASQVDSFMTTYFPGSPFREDIKIVDDLGNVWIVDKFTLKSWSTRYNCDCYRVV